MKRTSFGMSSSITRRSGAPDGLGSAAIMCPRYASEGENGSGRRRKSPEGARSLWEWRCSEALQRAIAGVGDLKQRVELGKLEERLEIVVQVGQPKLATLLADLLGQRDEHAEAGAVD